MNPPADGTPKNFAIQLETPRFWGGFSVFKSWTKKFGARPVHSLGGGGTTPVPAPAKGAGGGVRTSGEGGRRGKVGDLRERENLTIASIKPFVDDTCGLAHPELIQDA